MPMYTMYKLSLARQYSYRVAKIPKFCIWVRSFRIGIRVMRGWLSQTPRASCMPAICTLILLDTLISRIQ